MRTTNEQKSTVENNEKGTERGQQTVRHVAKTHVDHWFSRLRKRSYLDRASGRVVEIPDWQVRLKTDGGESWFNLGTANQAAAARKAKEIFTFLDANGWPATLCNYKHGANGANGNAGTALTIGEYLRVVEETGKLRPRTFLNYRTCLRTITAGVFGIRGRAGQVRLRNWRQPGMDGRHRLHPGGAHDA